MPADLVALLLDQWQVSPQIRAIVTDILTPMRDQAIAAALNIRDKQLNVDDAEGVWLDFLGVRLGVRRPATTDPTMDPRFGFDMSGVGFDQEPFRGDVANDAVFAVDDNVYRRFLRGRAITILSDGSITAFRMAVQHIDPAATAVDNRNRTVTITTALTEVMMLAESVHCIPTSAGVAIEIVTP